MKAVRFHEYGGPDVLRYEDAPEPTPGPGEVRLRVAAAAFNTADADIRAGLKTEAFPVTLPHIPSYDVSGTVEGLGEGVTEVAVGDEVIGFLSMVDDGAAAEYVLASADGVAKAPTGIALTDAAALPSVGLTAWQALFDDDGLAAGQRLLIYGAGGAVGTYAVQLAKAAGAHVIATAGPRGREKIESAGADEIVDYTKSAVTVDEPVDRLLSLAPISPEELATLTGLVGDGGVVVNTVTALATPGDAERGVRGVQFYVENDAKTLSSLVASVDRGELRVDVVETVPLSELRALHERAAAGWLPGKVVVAPSPE